MHCLVIPRQKGIKKVAHSGSNEVSPFVSLVLACHFWGNSILMTAHKHKNVALFFWTAFLCEHQQSGLPLYLDLTPCHGTLLLRMHICKGQFISMVCPTLLLRHDVSPSKWQVCVADPSPAWARIGIWTGHCTCKVALRILVVDVVDLLPVVGSGSVYFQTN